MPPGAPRRARRGGFGGWRRRGLHAWRCPWTRARKQAAGERAVARRDAGENASVATSACLAFGRVTRKSVGARLRCRDTCPRARVGRVPVTRSATHPRDVASSPSRVRLAALALLLALAAPAGPALAEPGAQAQAPDKAVAQLQFTDFDDKVFVEARRSGVPVVLYFEADWCGPCKEMHARTFRAPEVLEAAAGIRFFRVDLTNPNRQNDLLKNSFRVLGAPTLVLFGPDGKQSAHRFGFVTAGDFVEMLAESRQPARSSRPGVAPARC
ncbi:MAG: thioredoxin family protein [Candidatus Binatia bacterium]